MSRKNSIGEELTANLIKKSQKKLYQLDNRHEKCDVVQKYSKKGQHETPKLGKKEFPVVRPHGLGLGAVADSTLSVGKFVMVHEGLHRDKEGYITNMNETQGHEMVTLRPASWIRSTWDVLKETSVVSQITVHRSNLRELTAEQVNCRRAKIFEQCGWVTPGLVVRVNNASLGFEIHRRKFLVLNLVEGGFAVLFDAQCQSPQNESVISPKNTQSNSILPRSAINFVHVHHLDTVLGNVGSLVRIHTTREAGTVSSFSPRSDQENMKDSKEKSFLLGEIVRKKMATKMVEISVQKSECNTKASSSALESSKNTEKEIFTFSFDEVCSFTPLRRGLHDVLKQTHHNSL